MLNDYLEAIEQLIDAIQAKIEEHGEDAPASANLRKDVGVIESCTLRELLVHVETALSKTSALGHRVRGMLESAPPPSSSKRF